MSLKVVAPCKTCSGGEYLKTACTAISNSVCDTCKVTIQCPPTLFLGKMVFRVPLQKNLFESERLSHAFDFNDTHMLS